MTLFFGRITSSFQEGEGGKGDEEDERKKKDQKMKEKKFFLIDEKLKKVCGKERKNKIIKK